MAGKNKLTDQKAIDAIVDSIFKVAGTSRKQAPATGKNGKDGKDAPQINDDEALSTNPWSGLKTQEEIAKVEGKIYPCTSQALEAMSQEQQAELYVQGYRAIKTENNGTVVLLGLASDGSLEWLGCNQPRGNLLDNPDFALAQAGYGGLHGAQKYAADRWKNTYGYGTFSYANPGITMAYGTNDAYAAQVIAEMPEPGTYVTAAVLTDEFGELVGVGTFNTSGTQINVLSNDATFVVRLREGTFECIITSGSVTIRHARFLVGSYTPKTLPPWKAPNPTLELLKCMNYFRKTFYAGTRTTSAFFAISNAGGAPMRIAPTAIIDVISPYGASNINPAANDIIIYDNWCAVYAHLPSVPSQYNGVGLRVTEVADL